MERPRRSTSGGQGVGLEVEEEEEEEEEGVDDDDDGRVDEGREVVEEEVEEAVDVDVDLDLARAAHAATDVQDRQLLFEPIPAFFFLPPFFSQPNPLHFKVSEPGVWG